MGKILVKKDDPNFILSYDPVMARDPRFRVVEDERFQTAKSSNAVNVAERLNPDRVPDNLPPENAPAGVDESKYMEKVLIILEAIGVTDAPESIDDALDLAINRILNPVSVNELEAIPEASKGVEDIPDEETPEDVPEIYAPVPEEDEVPSGVVEEEELGFESIDDKDQLEAWARENMSLELDKRFSITKLKERIRQELAKQ